MEKIENPNKKIKNQRENIGSVRQKLSKHKHVKISLKVEQLYAWSTKHKHIPQNA